MAMDRRRRLLARWGWGSLFCTVAVTVVVVLLSRRSGEAVPAAGADVAGLTSVLQRDVGDTDVPLRFDDVTDRVGITFQHMTQPRNSLLPEDMGSGVASGDFDGDGFTDLFFVNFAGSVLPGTPLDREKGSSRLFRNLGGKHFEDVTQQAHIGFTGYGMGASWGDYDNDGDLDLYVTAFGPNALYENLGDGTFRDVTSRTGVQDDRFSAGCSWGDYDRDGNIDLYVCNYVDFVYREQDRKAMERQYSTEQPYTLNPSAYAPQPNSLFRNRGDGTFEEVSQAVGLDNVEGRSLSASWVDMDDDGWIDLYVANDVSNNGVFRNRGDGTFEDIGANSLAADYRGAMGIAVSDFDNDLDQDLFITHWIAQENVLYRNMRRDSILGDDSDGRLWFMDDAEGCGLGQISLDLIGWASGFCDFNNNGQRDLWVVNGSTLEHPINHKRLVAQPPLIFWNRGRDGFVDVARQALPDDAQPFVGRGGAQLDYDGDGLVDLVFMVHGGKARLLRNVATETGNWIRIALRQVGGNTEALGARAFVQAGGKTQLAQVGASSSYLSQDERVLHFGLADATTIESVRILWPDGVEEQVKNVAVNQQIDLYHTVDYAAVAVAGRVGSTRQNSHWRIGAAEVSNERRSCVVGQR